MMFPRTKKNSLTKKVLSVSLIGCITVTITAAGMQPFLVYASVGSGTLRGVLIGLSALMGTGNVNAASLNTLNSSAYVSDLSAYSSANMSESDLNALLSSDTGIARWIAPMSNNAQQVSLAQEYVSAAGGNPSGLQGLGAASAAKNIQASIDYYLEHGELKPSFGGQTMTDNIMGAAVMQSMADVAYNFDNVMWYARENGWTDEQIDALFDSGAAFGDLQSAVDYINNLDRTIATGSKVDIDQQTLDNIPVGYRYVFVDLQSRKSGSTKVKYEGYVPVSENIKTFGIFYKYDSQYYYGGFAFVNNADSSARCSVSYYENGSLKRTDGTISKHNYITNGLASRSENCIFIGIDEMYTNSQAYGNAVDTFKTGGAGQLNTSKPLSPDIITNNGQAQGTWTQDVNANNRNQFNLNININYSPNYNYTIPDETIINNYITNVQDDINNGEDQDTIGQDLLDLIEEMKQSIPQPTEEPYPTMSPSTIPVQPTEAPKPTNTPEQEQQNTTGMATPELANKFPFCIPFDIYSMMGNFVANRSAPYIKAELNLGPAGVHYIEIDMSEFNDVAALLRTLQLILFIVGLALVARRLIGAGGD